MNSVQTAYPPTPWVCPNCKKQHSKAHYAFEGQVDKSKPLGKPGRVLFNREGSDMVCDDHKYDTAISAKTGPAVVDGLEQPLFCPHCGWLAEVFHYKVVRRTVIEPGKCCIKGCDHKAIDKDSEYPMCWEHGKILKGDKVAVEGEEE